MSRIRTTPPQRPRHTAAIHLRLPQRDKLTLERMSGDLGISTAAIIRLAVHQFRLSDSISLRSH